MKKHIRDSIRDYITKRYKTTIEEMGFKMEFRSNSYKMFEVRRFESDFGHTSTWDERVEFFRRQFETLCTRLREMDNTEKHSGYQVAGLLVGYYTVPIYILDEAKELLLKEHEHKDVDWRPNVPIAEDFYNS